jgi:hypothetical protein
MFFPDKARGVREAWRVLAPGGRYLLSVWGAVERNPIARITHETAASFFPSDPPQFYTVPFSLHDTARVSTWLRQAGFEDVEPVAVERTGESPSAADAAIGLVDGNPLCVEIMDRRPEALGEVRAAVAKNLAAQLGDRPMRTPLHAFFFVARKP